PRQRDTVRVDFCEQRGRLPDLGDVEDPDLVALTLGEADDEGDELLAGDRLDQETVDHGAEDVVVVESRQQALVERFESRAIQPRSVEALARQRGLNENYARELMELHTLGVDGGYTQDDVIDVANTNPAIPIGTAVNPFWDPATQNRSAPFHPFGFDSANVNILEHIVHFLGMTMDQTHMTIEKYANTAAASIAVTLDEAVRLGKIKKGDIVGLLGFGGGLAWAANVLRWAV
ncbi:MAG: DUF1800 family protein, partial [Nitrospinae bacterium]|nr:DUF1800 family protein [Nitrospinota bacterium]